MRPITKALAIAGLLFALISPLSPGNAQPPANWKPQTLSDTEEKRWIDAVKLHKTNDGANVMQVLEFAERMRPTKFKIQAFEVVYSGKDGKPDGVRIGYWIGKARLPGDEFADLGYDIEQNGSGLTAVPPVNRYTSDTIVVALEGGRNSFLAYVDKMYQDTCTDHETRAKTC